MGRRTRQLRRMMVQRRKGILRLRQPSQPPIRRARFPRMWSRRIPADFRQAKVNRDPRIVKAVEVLGRSGFAADENAALLVELLTPELPGGYGGVSVRVRGIPGLPTAIVQSLGTNPSKRAKSALREIVLGKLTSDLEDQIFTLWAMRALVENPSPETDMTLYAILTAPEAVRPPGAVQ